MRFRPHTIVNGLLYSSLTFNFVCAVFAGLMLIPGILEQTDLNVRVNVYSAIALEILAFIFMIMAAALVSSWSTVNLKKATFILSVAQISQQIGFVYLLESLRYNPTPFVWLLLLGGGVMGVISFVLNIVVIFHLLTIYDFQDQTRLIKDISLQSIHSNSSRRSSSVESD